MLISQFQLVEAKYTVNIFFMCKYPKYDTNMPKRTNSFNILVIINEAK